MMNYFYQFHILLLITQTVLSQFQNNFLELPSIEELIATIENELPTVSNNPGSFNDPSDTNDADAINEAFVQMLLNDGIIPSNPTTPSPVERNCECVPRAQCADSDNIELGLLSFVDLRTQTCQNALDICCEIGRRVSIQKPNEPPLIPPSVPSSCGKRNDLGLNFTIGFFKDSQSQIGEFPWTAAVIRTVIQNNMIFENVTCGGSLIHPQVVLTSAHNIELYNRDELRVRLGEWDFDSTNEPYSHEDISIQRIIIHPRYVRQNLNDNLALLILSRPVMLRGNINTVCLPLPNVQYDRNKCYSAGWGKNVFGINGQYQKIQKKVQLPLVDRGSCERSLGIELQRPGFRLDPSYICAGGNGQDTCTGDGGSPLMCKRIGGSNSYVQVGVVAWGIKCHQPGLPSAYSSTEANINWIQQEVISIFGESARQYFT